MLGSMKPEFDNVAPNVEAYSRSLLEVREASNRPNQG